jgi:hypothetical protein
VRYVELDGMISLVPLKAHNQENNHDPEIQDNLAHPDDYRSSGPNPF